jgi:hypothetical protein
MRLPRTPLAPLWTALLVLTLVGFAAELRQIAAPTPKGYRPPSGVPRSSVVQSDFRILIGANRAYLAGARDYAETQASAQEADFDKRIYGYPPFVYTLFASLNFFGEEGARLVWLFAFPPAFLLALYAYLRAALPRLREQRPAAYLLAALCFLTSASTLLLLERGNFDWVVLTLYLLGLALIAQRRGALAGLPLGMAIALKAYPLAIVPFLLALRRWRELASTLATVAVIVLVTGPKNNLQWLVSVTAERMHVRALHPLNTSLANLLRGFDNDMAPSTANTAGLALFLVLGGALFALVAYLRWRGREIDPAQLGALILPLMFMIPALTWSYTLFSLGALLLVLANSYARPSSPRLLLLVMGAIIGLCQSPIFGFRLVRPYILWSVPILSLCLVLLTVLAAWALLRGVATTPTEEQARDADGVR